MISQALLESNLDESQRAFCSQDAEALRMLAPAGSGKTQALLWRCLNLVLVQEEKTPRFLIVTFTRAARDELRDRVETLPVFEPLRSQIEITTLNSWGFRRLKARNHNLRLCVTPKDRHFCINNILQPLWQEYPEIKSSLSSTRKKARFSRALMDLIDSLKGMGFHHEAHCDLKSFSNHLEWLEANGLRNHVRAFFKVLDDLEIVDASMTQKNLNSLIMDRFMGFWSKACVRMYESALITLEDQKYWAFIDLEKSVYEKRFSTGVHRFQHILVDEFQDINVLDLNLLKMIAAANKCKLTIAGDDDQAIFEWRGASPEFILNPGKHLGHDYVTCILETNYRSPSNIVRHSQQLIRKNIRRVPKNVRAHSKVEAEILALRMPNLVSSVEFILKTVRGMLSRTDIGNVAIIGRKRSQIIPYQIIFAAENIPFYAAEDLQIFLSEAFEELKQILVVKARAGQPPDFLGVDTVEDLLRLCDKIKRYPLKKSDRDALRGYLLRARPKTLLNAIETFYEYRGPLKGENRNGEMTSAFYQAIKSLLSARTVSESIDAVSQHFEGLQKDYGKSLDDIFYADPPFLYLSDYAQRYGDDFPSFYNDIQKAIDTLAKVPPEDEEEHPHKSWKLPLHLMTALRAKGKEFDAVIILDVNSGIWPSKLAKTEEEREQERRLFYVAFTRARKRLTLLINDSIIGEKVFPSHYIQELGLEIFDVVNSGPVGVSSRRPAVD